MVAGAGLNAQSHAQTGSGPAVAAGTGPSALTAVQTGAHTHDGDPVVSEHVRALHQAHPRNGQRDDDGRLPMVPVKGDDRRKIDGGLADILAYEAAMTMPEAAEAQGAVQFFTLSDLDDGDA